MMKDALRQLQDEGTIGLWKVSGEAIDDVTILTDPKPELTQDDIDDAELRYNKSNKKQSVYNKRDDENIKKLTYNSNTYTIGEQGKAKFVEALTSINAGILSTPVTWTLDDNSTVELDEADIKGIATALTNRENANYAHARTLISQIEAATSQDDLDAIDITTGWNNG